MSETRICPFCGKETDKFIMFRGDIVGCRYCGISKKQTNADRIRSMSDEELATVIAWPYWASTPWCSEHRTCPYISEDPTPCDKCVLDWLKQEATDDP